MQFLNVGILELVFLLLLIMIVLGPQRTVKAASDVGRWIRDFSKSELWREIVHMSKDIQELPNQIMDEAELQETIDALERSAYDVNRSLEEAHHGIDDQLSQIEREISDINIQPEQLENNEDNSDNADI